MNVSHVGDGSRNPCAGIVKILNLGKLATVVHVKNVKRQWTQMTGIINSSQGVNITTRKARNI